MIHRDVRVSLHKLGRILLIGTLGLLAACAPRVPPIAPPSGGYQQRYEAEVAGLDFAEFIVPVRAGQTLALILSGDTAVHFDLVPPGGGARIFTSTIEQRTYAQAVDQSGSYVVRVYLIGSRESSGAFALDVIVTGQNGPPEKIG
ncbi:hypothetical protein [Amaricoccus macauensis]|uniref:hypothetical protein n=1 Tax=Amaricoccus macauensis TaxID=57001 RepID=UPI003C7EC1FE